MYDKAQQSFGKQGKRMQVQKRYGLFTAFAYEGWIVATSINAEMKNGRRDLPRALVLGASIVVAVYILYYVGLAGGVSNEAMMQSGEAAARQAFEKVFSRAGGTALFVFVVISCLGTLNGLMLGCVRGMYALSARRAGPRPGLFGTLDGATGMPANSSVLGLSVACCLFMMTAACFSHRMAVVYYLAVFAAVMAPGAFFAPRHKQ